MVPPIFGAVAGAIAHLFIGSPANPHTPLPFDLPPIHTGVLDLPRPVNMQLEFVAYLFPDASALRPIKTINGQRFNVAVTGGNWTAPSGELLATVASGIGSEYGYVDNGGVFHVDVRYTVQFVSDEYFGYVQRQGLGVFGGNNEAYVTVETDSKDHKNLSQKFLFSPGTFNENGVLVAPHFSFPAEPVN